MVQRMKPGGGERILVIRKEDRLVCMAHGTRMEGTSAERIDSFFPTVDKARRAAVEDDLVATFVTDSFAHGGQDGERMECVFLFDCAPKGRNEKNSPSSGTLPSPDPVVASAFRWEWWGLSSIA